VAITKKRLRQRSGFALGGHLPFFHGFEQGALRLRGGAVDFVGQQHLREYRAGQEPEIAALAVEDRDAEDVRRQHVAGELDARELESEQAGQGVRQRRLADAGQIFNQQMAFCQQAAEGEAGLRALAEDHRIGGGKDSLTGEGLVGMGGWHGLSWWRNWDDNKPSAE
jgi:hypothetical protein